MHFPQIYIYNGIILISNSLFHLYKIKNKVRFFFGFWVFGAGWIMLGHGIFYSNWLLKYPSFYGLISFGKYVSMSGIILTFYYLINPQSRWNFKWLLVFLPALYPGINFYFFLKETPELKTDIIVKYLESGKPEKVIIEPLWFTNIYMVIITALIIIYVTYKIQWKILIKDVMDIEKLKYWIFVFLILTVNECILYTLFVNFSDILPNRWEGILDVILMANAIFVVLGFQVFMIMLRNEYKEITGEFFTVQKYIKSYLNNLDLEEIDKKLAKLVNEKFYSDPEITATIVASKLNISLHQLSEYFNQKCKCTFRNYLNSKRLDDCIQDLLYRPEQTITQIWLDAGFNSSSAFYRVFKEKIGMSPEEYRENAKRHQKQIL